VKRAVLCWIVAASGCQTLNFFGNDEGANVVYGADAEENMKKGDDALDSKNYIEAQKYYDFVKSKYPYLEASKLAELKLGDTDFARERYMEARDRYVTFVKLHPSHPKVDYAAYRAAYSYYKDVPSDFFLLPSSAEKDQGNLRSSLVAFNDFLRTYPKSEYVPEAEKTLVDIKKRLAEHEMYVAGFYAKRDKWAAVVNRLSIVVRDYPGTGYDEEAYLDLYDAYLKLKDEEKAKGALRSLINRAPESKGAKKARSLLGDNG
jgi:outer membrane protein assembly factor BamD